eukprot:CAMPEP_0113642188 /NCGR_PEP_ID=MMETSP0017_2-20120614/22162_1 /TAXON_ID=2856 /ORGANISM="Cylindrotheca closterium" /LENGTH=947 /DNA_ID=CAMNT_0000553597 /DNA_START=23 /DNA_END=2867 /DNA_ORIENTATION=- /assembly_acc=CAM_ASM_000147
MSSDAVLFGSDEKAKAKSKSGSKASKPGVVSVNEDNADEIVFGSDEKAKAKSRSGSKASKPGVVAVDKNSDEVLFGKEKSKMNSSSHSKGSKSSRGHRGSKPRDSNRSKSSKHRDSDRSSNRRRKDSGRSASKQKDGGGHRASDDSSNQKDRSKADADAQAKNNMALTVVGIGDVEKKEKPAVKETKGEENPGRSWKPIAVCVGVIMLISIIVAVILLTKSDGNEVPIYGANAVETISPTTPSTTASPTSAPVSSLAYDPPSADECIRIENGLFLLGQDELQTKPFQIDFDIAIKDPSLPPETWVPEFKKGIDEVLIPALAGCPVTNRRLAQVDKDVHAPSRLRQVPSTGTTSLDQSPQRGLQEIESGIRYVIANAKSSIDPGNDVTADCEIKRNGCNNVKVTMELSLKGDERAFDIITLIAQVLQYLQDLEYNSNRQLEKDEEQRHQRKLLARILGLDPEMFENVSYIAIGDPSTTAPVGQPTPSTTAPVGQPTPSTTAPVGQPTPSTTAPVGQPTPITTAPVGQPLTAAPTNSPSPGTTPSPTMVAPAPTPLPTKAPTPGPTPPPAPGLTSPPTPEPTPGPTPQPTLEPTPGPTPEPTPGPTQPPTPPPTPGPTKPPTPGPTPTPTPQPSSPPTLVPTLEPTPSPTVAPTVGSSPSPTTSPSVTPTLSARKLALDTILSPAKPFNAQAFSWISIDDTWGDPISGSETDYQWMERYVFALLYYTCGGDGWANNDGWLTSTDICTWAKGSDYCDEGKLNFSQNYVSGTQGLPSEIGLLTTLKKLTISVSNGYYGSLPTEIGYLTGLISIVISKVQLSGSMPTELGLLTNLRTLWLGHSSFTGSIPTEIGYLSQLKKFQLINCDSLSGTLPAGLGRSTSLTSLEVVGGQFTGNIPTQLGYLTLLAKLILRDANFVGTIPNELGTLTKMNTLILKENALTGSIPTVSEV